MLFATPEYAGGLPGSLKNALDWTLAGGELDQMPVGWVDVADPGHGSGAHAPDEYLVIESSNPKVTGWDGAVRSFVDYLYELAGG